MIAAKLISISSAIFAMQNVQATSPVPSPLCPFYNWGNPGAYCLDDGSLYHCDYAGSVPAYMIDSCSGWGSACISNAPYHADYCERGNNNNNGNSNRYTPFLDEFEAPQYGFAVRGHNDQILYGVMSHAECAYECYQQNWCKSFEMADFDHENRCILSGATSPVFAPNVYEHGTWTLYIKSTWVPVIPPTPQPGFGRQCEKPVWTGGAYCTGNFGDFKGKDLGFQLCYPNIPKPVPYLLPGYELVEETCNRWESSMCGAALTDFVNSCCPHKYRTSDFASMVSICASTDLVK